MRRNARSRSSICGRRHRLSRANSGSAAGLDPGVGTGGGRDQWSIGEKGRGGMKFPNAAEHAKYTRRFRELFPKSHWAEAVAVVLAYAACIAATIAASVALYRVDTLAGIVAYPVAVWFIGTRFRAYINIVHECVHNGFTRINQHNALIGELLSMLLLISFRDYKSHHATHHIYTGDYDRDLDFINSKHYDFHIPMDRSLLRRHLRRLFSPALLREYIGYKIYDPRSPLSWRVARLGYLAALAVVGCYDFNVWSGTYIVLLYVIVPRFVALPLIGYMSDLLDHAGVLGQANDVDKSRNYIVENRILREIFFPRNDCFHLLHHLFQVVPTKHFPACHKILMEENPEYAAKSHRLVEWIQSPYTVGSRATVS
jgi:fatty acid desaturase